MKRASCYIMDVLYIEHVLLNVSILGNQLASNGRDTSL